MHGEVGVGVIGEGLLSHDLQAHLGGLGDEALGDAGGVGVAVVVDHSHLGSQAIFRHIVGSGDALVGVSEAHLEDVILAGSDVGGGSGGSQLKVALVEGLSSHGDAGSGGGAAIDDLHAVALQGVVGVDGLLSVTLVILKLQGELDTAQGVDLVHRDLSPLLGGDAIGGGGASQGTDAADLCH